jgi:hypothetical protein
MTRMQSPQIAAVPEHDCILMTSERGCQALCLVSPTGPRPWFYWLVTRRLRSRPDILYLDLERLTRVALLGRSHGAGHTPSPAASAL